MPPDMESSRRKSEGFSTLSAAKPSTPSARRIMRQRAPMWKKRSKSSTSSAAVPTLCTIRSAKGGVFSSIAGTVPRV